MANILTCNIDKLPDDIIEIIFKICITDKIFKNIIDKNINKSKKSNNKYSEGDEKNDDDDENEDDIDEGNDEEDEEIIKQKKMECVFLKFLNKMLVNLEKEKINKVTDFKKIDREDILEQKSVFASMENDLFLHFDKIKCGWYRRNYTRDYNMTFFKKAIELLGYKLVSNKKSMPCKINGKINGKKISLTHTFYSIV